MEQSRYQYFHRFYTIGFISLILGMLFIGVSLYLFPLVFFNINIDVPFILFKWVTWLDFNYHMDEPTSLKFIWGFFMLLGLFLVLIADVSSNYIDNKLLKLNKIYKPEEFAKEHEKEMIELKHLIMILCIAILLVLGGLKLFQLGLFKSLL